MNQPAIRVHALLSFLTVFIVFFISITGTLTQADAAPYQLMVNKGRGGGFYEPSSIVHISASPYDTSDPATSTSEPADPAAPIRIFDRWTGDTAAIKDIMAKDTTLVMPSQNITITAQFKESPRWTLPRMMAYFPENPVGVIYLFHGSGAAFPILLADPEVTRFVDQAFSHRFAVSF